MPPVFVSEGALEREDRRVRRETTKAHASSRFELYQRHRFGVFRPRAQRPHENGGFRIGLPFNRVGIQHDSSTLVPRCCRRFPNIRYPLADGARRESGGLEIYGLPNNFPTHG
jgi:hypothetical protein